MVLHEEHLQIDSVIEWKTERYGPVNHHWLIDFGNPGPSGWWIGFLHAEDLMMFMLRWGNIIGTYESQPISSVPSYLTVDIRP